MDDAGPRGPRAATAAVRALLVRGSSKLCESLGRGAGRLLTFSPSFSPPAHPGSRSGKLGAKSVCIFPAHTGEGGGAALRER